MPRVCLIFVLLCGITAAQRIPSHCIDDNCTRTGMIVENGGVRSVAPAAHWVRLQWLGSPGANWYNVYRGDQTGGPYTQINTSYAVHAQGCADLDVPAGTHYYVATAGNDAGESGYSNEVQAVVP